MGETVKLQASDGFELGAYLSKPEGDPLAGLVVIQEVFGVNPHIRSVADKFARNGFFAVAPAIFDRIEKNVELSYEGEDMKKAMALMQKLSLEDALKDVDAALRYVQQKTGKATMTVGFCYGGTLAWLSATRLKPAAAVGYYGGQIAKFVEEKPRVPVMLHFGREDTHIPQADVEKIQKTHPEVQIYTYEGAGHGFNCDARASYNAKAATLAFSRTLDFLKSHVVNQAAVSSSFKRA